MVLSQLPLRVFASAAMVISLAALSHSHAAQPQTFRISRSDRHLAPTSPKRRQKRPVLIEAKPQLAPVATSPTAGFSAGNLVVCRVGDGSAALSSAASAVFLDEYTPSGSYVSTVAMPVAPSGSNDALTLAGTGGASFAASECQLTLSANGRYLVLAGYIALPGTAGVNGTTVGRVIARVDANGTVNTSTSTSSFGSSVVRSAASNDGSGFWVVGASAGVVYVPLGGVGPGTVVSSTVSGSKVVNIIDGQLYVSTNAGSVRVGTVGAGMPVSTGNTMSNISGLPLSGSPIGYFFADLDASVAGADTLYVADDGTGTGVGGGGVKKYALIGVSWTYKGTFPASPVPSIAATLFYGLTGTVSGSTVTLFATRLGTASSNQLVSFVDTTGYNAVPTAVPTLLATAAVNTVFRGVAAAPALAPTAARVSLAGRVLTANGEGLKNAVVVLEGGSLTQPRTAITGPFGYYAFGDLPAGLTYILSVKSKRYSFADPTRVVSLDTELLDANFIAEPQE
ncbi:MAG: carboxypeptidase-like regulatory domain-containing protein [Acidobacteriota bacterium]